jgi:YNFM family putative membrane transporter
MLASSSSSNASRNADLRAVAALCLAAVAVFADMYITQPLLPIFSREYGVSPAVAGATISAVVLTIALVSSAYGPLGAVLGQKRVMCWGCGLLAVSTFACAFAPSFSILLVLRAVQGLLVPAVAAIAIAYIGELRGGLDTGALVGAYIGASVAGGLIGRVASGAIFDVTGSWRAAFIVLGGLTLVAAIAMALTLQARPLRRDGPLRAAFGGAYRAMWQHFGDVRLLGAFVVGGTLFFGFIGIFTYLPYLLTAAPYRLSTGTVAWFYLAYLAGVVTAPIAGRLSARISRRALIAAGFSIALAGTALTLLPSVAAIAAGAVVLCVGMFTAQAVAPAFVTVTAATAKGGAMALYQTFYYIGAVFGSVLPGFAWEIWGWPGVVASCGASLVLGLATAVLFCADAPRWPQGARQAKISF